VCISTAKLQGMFFCTGYSSACSTSLSGHCSACPSVQVVLHLLYCNEHPQPVGASTACSFRLTETVHWGAFQAAVCMSLHIKHPLKVWCAPAGVPASNVTWYCPFYGDSCYFLNNVTTAPSTGVAAGCTAVKGHPVAW
jgi:hypothetical protein